MTIKNELIAYGDRRAQPGSPHDSTLDATLGSQTKTMAYRASGTVHGWQYFGGNVIVGNALTFHHPHVANITAINTWTTFKVGAYGGLTGVSALDCQYPWRFTEQYERIFVRAKFAAHVKAHFDFRFYTDDHNGTGDAFAATNGESYPIGTAPVSPDDVWWREINAALGGGFFMYEGQSAVVNPTLAANRRCVLIPQVRLAAQRHADVDESATIHVFLYSIHAMDWAEVSEGY